MGFSLGTASRWPAATCRIACLACVALAGFADDVQAASSSAQPLKLEHMDYSQARKMILRQGWKPLGGVCPGVNQNTCDRFPEIDVCAGVWPGNCAMVFVKQAKCLYVTTSGGEPVGDTPGDTHVEEVALGDGPCTKN